MLTNWKLMSFSSGKTFFIMFWTLGKKGFKVNYASQFLMYYHEAVQGSLNFPSISKPYFPIALFSRYPLHCD